MSVLIAVGSGKARVPISPARPPSRPRRPCADAASRSGRHRRSRSTPSAGSRRRSLPRARWSKAGAPVSIFYATPKPAAAAAGPSCRSRQPGSPRRASGGTVGRGVRPAPAVALRRGAPRNRPRHRPAERDAAAARRADHRVRVRRLPADRLLQRPRRPARRRRHRQAAGRGRRRAGDRGGPRWAPDGKRIAFIADERVYVKALDGSPRAVTVPGWGLQGPRVVSARRRARRAPRPERDTDLCLIGVGARSDRARAARPSRRSRSRSRCTGRPTGRRCSASAGGPPRRPPASCAGRLRRRSPLTRRLERGRVHDRHRDAGRRSTTSRSPDGKRIAAAANFGFGEHRLWLGDASDLSLESARPTRLRACKVAWRADGRELAVTQADAAARRPTAR